MNNSLTNLPETPGIYAWMHGPIYLYIGKALDVLRRAKQHLHALQHHKHPCRDFQTYYDARMPSVFTVECVKQCRRGELDMFEKRFIAQLGPLFNKQISRGLAFKARQPKRHKCIRPARAMGTRMVPQIRNGRTIWITRKLKPRKAA